MTHRIVIVGGGAGGLELATRLGKSLGKRKQAEITLVDARLTHIWKPLLHEVAAGSLNSSGNELNYLAQAKWNHFAFQLGRLSGLDRQSRTIRLEAVVDEAGQELVPPRTLSYDTLVIAIGSRTNDFGTPGASEHCTFLDTPEQAVAFHHQLLNRYLAAHAHAGQGGLFGREMVHPVFKAVDATTPLAGTLTPVYPTVSQLPQAYLRKAIASALQRAPLAEVLPPDALPPGVPPLRQALQRLHHPPPDASLTALSDHSDPAWQRLKFEELLAQQLSQHEARRERAHLRAPELHGRRDGLRALHQVH